MQVWEFFVSFMGVTDLTSQATASVASGLASTPFPDSSRVLYAKNPLVEVICQLRFPPILRIDSEVPANFQDRIRNAFPLFSDEDPAPYPELPPEILQLVKVGLTPQATRKTWKFEAETGGWGVTLTREFVALSTTSYSRWEEFRAKLQGLIGALQSEYQPSFLTRIGLRYQNLIVRSSLGLGSSAWRDLLQPRVAAEFSSPDLASAVREAAHRVLIELGHGRGSVNLRHGTARKQGEEEVSYLIDSDFFTEEKMEVANALDRLGLFNREAGHLFRWCITDQLHEAMEPAPLPE